MLRRTFAVLLSAILLVGLVPGVARPGRAGAASTSGRAGAIQVKLLGELATLLKNARAGDSFKVVVRLDARNSVSAAALAPRQEAVTATWSTVLHGFAARLTKAEIERLAADPAVRQVELDIPVRAFLDTAVPTTGVAAARKEFRVDGNLDGDPRRYSRDDVVVAVIDTGIDAGHVDLAGGKVIGWFDEQNGLPFPYDDQGHGTHVASIIAGTGSGDRRYAGVAPGAALVGVKVMDALGQGEMSDIITGIDWVVANKDRFNIRVANVSLGGGLCVDGTDAMSEAVNRAVEAGIIFVVAAGNSGPGRCTVGAPAAAERAITIGAAYDPGEKGWALAEFSSRGPTGDGRLKPDIVTPGRNITAAKANSKNKYVTYSGTSMATPYMAGVIALMLAANPDLTVEGVKQILYAPENVKDFGLPGKDPEYGHGIALPYNLVAAAGGQRARGWSDKLRHVFYTGELAYMGHEMTFRFKVTDRSQPVAVSVNLPTWKSAVLDYGTPAFQVQLLDSQGKVEAETRGGSGAELILAKPKRTGQYTVGIRSLVGEGPFLLDISYR